MPVLLVLDKSAPPQALAARFSSLGEGTSLGLSWASAGSELFLCFGLVRFGISVLQGYGFRALVVCK